MAKDLNLDDFMKSIKIEKVNGGEFGYYPPMAHILKKDGDLNILALALDGVQQIYPAVRRNVGEDSENLLIAIDFPAKSFLDGDIVVVHNVQFTEGREHKIETVGIVYSTETGQVLQVIEDHPYLKVLSKDFSRMLTCPERDLVNMVAVEFE